jgi:choline dehydrogenase
MKAINNLLPVLLLPLATHGSPLVKRASGVTSSGSVASSQTFDYIVVGGGLAGTTVAARLAENASHTILLIEAGGDNRTNPLVYDIYEYGQAFNTSLVWNWKTDLGKEMIGYAISSLEPRTLVTRSFLLAVRRLVGELLLMVQCGHAA